MIKTNLDTSNMSEIQCEKCIKGIEFFDTGNVYTVVSTVPVKRFEHTTRSDDLIKYCL